MCRLVRYTDLSERTVRTCLDRLEAAGVIRPCDPAVVAAKIKRADHRPQGWDLAMDLIRDDLDGDEIETLARQFPGLVTRVGARDGGRRDGVQPLHPAPEDPVDNVADEVQPLHLAAPTGCNHRSDGVQPFPQRGATAAPEPSIEPSREPSAARAHARETAPAVDSQAGEAAAERYFDELGPQWRLTAVQRNRLTPAVEAAVAGGWAPDRLAEFTGGNSTGVRNPYAVLSARLSPDQLPAGSGSPSTRPPWCGQCDQKAGSCLTSSGTPAPPPAPSAARSAESANRAMRAHIRRPRRRIDRLQRSGLPRAGQQPARRSRVAVETVLSLAGLYEAPLTTRAAGSFGAVADALPVC